MVGGREPDQPGHRDRPAGRRGGRPAELGAGSARSPRRPPRRPAAPRPRRSPSAALKASTGSRAILATEQMALLTGTQTVWCRPISTWSCRMNSTQTAVPTTNATRGQRAVAQEAELVGPPRLTEQEDRGHGHRGGRAERVRSWRPAGGSPGPASGRKRTSPLRSPRVERLASKVIAETRAAPMPTVAGGSQRAASAQKSRPERRGQAGAQDQRVRAASHRLPQVAAAGRSSARGLRGGRECSSQPAVMRT